MSNFLYVIAGSGSSGPVKMGFSADPEGRLRSLQTANPDKLRVFHTEEVDDHKVRVMERLLHRDLNHHRTRGEWFTLTPEEARRQVIFAVMRWDEEIDDSGKLKKHWRPQSVSERFRDE